MENATKALLIAASVLVAILIISLGLVVYNMAAETVNDSANLSEYEIQAYNEKFTKYLGDNKSGTTVNSLITTAFNHNLAQDSIDIGKQITLTVGSETIISPNQTTSPKKVDTGKRYSVQATYDASSKLITSITVTAAGSNNNNNNNNNGGN